MSALSLELIYRRLYRSYGPQRWWPARSDLEMILGAILTQNTAWSNVEKSIRSLKEEGLLTLKALEKVSLKTLERAIRSSGFFKVKAGRIKSFLRYLMIHHALRLAPFLKRPAGRLRKELLAIHGIGPETADSIILYGAGKPVFVVDAYTRRIFKRLGFLKGDEDYEAIRGFFEERLPRRRALFNEFHALIVRHGKAHCRKKPLCVSCPVNDVCPKLI